MLEIGIIINFRHGRGSAASHACEHLASKCACCAVTQLHFNTTLLSPLLIAIIQRRRQLLQHVQAMNLAGYPLGYAGMVHRDASLCMLLRRITVASWSCHPQVVKLQHVKSGYTFSPTFKFGSPAAEAEEGTEEDEGSGDLTFQVLIPTSVDV